MMSFGGIAIDAVRPTDRAPGLSLMTGLLGNALGLEHRDCVQLQRLQDRIRLGVRCDLPGARLEDYQTVDLGQLHLIDSGWTTDGVLEKRTGGPSSTGTHIRKRSYLADASYLAAVALDPPGEDPDVERLAACLDQPARPLFIGRKSCLPSGRMFAGLVDAATLEEALLSMPLHRPRAQPTGATLELWLPTEEATLDGHTCWTSDRRDWANQIHVDRRLWLHKMVTLGGGEGG